MSIITLRIGGSEKPNDFCSRILTVHRIGSIFRQLVCCMASSTRIPIIKKHLFYENAQLKGPLGEEDEWFSDAWRFAIFRA